MICPTSADLMHVADQTLSSEVADRSARYLVPGVDVCEEGRYVHNW